MALVKAGSRQKADAAEGAKAAPVLEVGALLDALQSADTATRRHAARDLAGFPDAVPALCARLAVDTAASVRSVLFTSLARLKSRAVVEGLLPYLHSDDAGLRNGVIEVLQDMPDEVGPHMDSMLADEESDVRIFAVNVLSSLAHANAPHWLVRVIREDPHVNVCAAAVDCLTEVGESNAVPHLEALIARFPHEPFIEFAANAAIRRIRGS